jgi:hypothetical protein
MKEFPDDELDKLFRKSAEELDSNFDPQDWNALKKRLDENDGRTTGAWLKKWWPAGLLALLMLAGLTTYLLTDNYKKEDKKIAGKVNQLPADNQIQEKTAGKILADTITERDEDLSLLENNVLDNAEKRIKTGKNNITKEDKLKRPENGSEFSSEESNPIFLEENKKALPRRGSKTGGVYLEPNHSIGRKGGGAIISASETEKKGKRNTLPDQKTDDPVKETSNQEVAYDSADNQSEKEDFQNLIINKIETNSRNIDVEKTEPEKRLNIPVTALKSKVFVWKQAEKLPIVEGTKIPQVSKTEEIENSISAEKQPEPKFAVRFGYSPDISSTGLKNLTKPGTAVSLLIEYSFLPKLYFQTGLIRSSKGYNAKAGEYEWPSSWNNQKVRPTSVDAICKVIEIPLNLRFDIAQHERSRWFVGAGASSYFMQNEKYDYKYPLHSYNIIWKDYETSTGWYWLSHLNASAGLEYRFSKKLSLLAEPYVRVPIKKVGYGKVDLFSAGMWFSIRYTPVFKK